VAAILVAAVGTPKTALVNPSQAVEIVADPSNND